MRWYWNLGFAPLGDEIEIDAEGWRDLLRWQPMQYTIAGLTPAEALELAEDDRLDGRIAHAIIMNMLTHHYLGTEIRGSVYLERFSV